MTVRARLSRPGIPSIETPRRHFCRRDPGTRSAAGRFEHSPRVLSCHAGDGPAALRRSRAMGVTPSRAPAETAFSTFCSDAARGRIREQWSSRSCPFVPSATGRQTRLRASPYAPNVAVRTTERSARAHRRVPLLHDVTEPHAALTACRLSSPRLSSGEKSERGDRHDRGLEPLQLATAGSIRDPTRSISSDFGAGG